MALITWNENLSVNIQEFDQHHKKLIDMINNLHQAMKQGKGKDVLEDILKGLVEYTDFHFKTEEEYFKKFNYPESRQHIQEHNAFVKKVVDFVDTFKKGDLGLSIEISSFLSDWLKTHINGTDKKYSTFLNDKGIV
ncbi:MAG: hemerythrin family protein [Anaerolineaceae bacterium]|nr:hemerythrin family protein [Anaerolineaceae bacterium]